MKIPASEKEIPVTRPLVKEGLIGFDIIPPAPSPGFTGLFKDGSC